MPDGMRDTGRRATIALREAVRQLPSTMARLAFLSGLRDPNSGAYRITSKAAEEAEIDRFLRDLHEQTFCTWLNYRLEEQKADLDLYFSSLACGKAAAVRAWLRLESYRSLVPESARSVERQLFFSDIEVLLHLITQEVRGLSEESDEIERHARAKPFLTTKKLSKWLDISPRTLRLWAESQEIPAVKVGRQWRFSREDVRDWLKRERGGG